MPQLSLGISPCPNDVFIFSGLILGEVTSPTVTFDIRYDDVQTCNERAAAGELDIAKISYALYPSISTGYELLPCGGALGNRCGPLLLANGRAAFDPAAAVLVPGAQTTANFLLDYYIGRPLNKRFVPFDALYEELLRTPGSQGVVIHEKRFTYAADGLTLLQDLGDHWEATTGFPIPLGAIVVRRACHERDEIIRLIRASLAWAYAHPEEALALCREHAQDLTPAVMQAHIDLYVNAFSDDLGPVGQRAVAYFLSAATAFPDR